MAVDLSDLIESVQRETSPPGTDLFPDATDDEWLGQLTDSFWEAKLYGFFSNYSASEDGIITPISGTDEFPRDQQQLVVLFAGVRAIRMKLMTTSTNFRAKAGPVEFEQSNSANLLKEILQQLNDKIQLVLDNLSDTLGAITVTYINGVYARNEALIYGDEYWWG